MKIAVGIALAFTASLVHASPFVVTVGTDVTTAVLGAEFGVRVEVFNVSSPSHNVVLSGTVPTTLRLRDVAGGVGWSCAVQAQEFQCVQPSLGPGAVGAIMLNVTADHGPTPVVVTALVTEQGSAWPATGSSAPIAVNTPDAIYMSGFEGDAP